ncbi:hypothetical protein KC19_6G110600 [Ceratodon purpureus]|uniref:Uncharacterized protein n=1 Tax=Ceratodon purpureus TaxID=3225 RepID=A0A8T0HH69_CERPU|nr:hypothetical protein KC19_6G110600 [Ceratodon purpureus]
MIPIGKVGLSSNQPTQRSTWKLCEHEQRKATLLDLPPAKAWRRGTTGRTTIPSRAVQQPQRAFPGPGPPHPCPDMPSPAHPTPGNAEAALHSTGIVLAETRGRRH